MDLNDLELLKKQYDFDAWAGDVDLGQSAVRRNVSLPKVLFSDLEPGRIREIDPGDGTRLVRASWSTRDEQDVGISADVRECESIEKAREIMLEMLGNLQAPDIQRMREPIGDVSFSGKSSNFSIFVRGNIAVYIRAIGDTKASIDEYARAIDKAVKGETP